MPPKPTKPEPGKRARGIKGQPIRDRHGNVVCGKKGKSGPPKGSMNALKNGSGHQNKRRLTVGELPRTMISVKREGRKYRRDLEEEVIAVKGNIDLTDAHLVDTAAAATIQAGICRWLLRNRIEDMNVGDIRGCTADAVKAKERRDRAVQQLHLNDKPLAPWIVTVGDTDD